MSVTDIRPGHAASDASREAADKLRAALRDLPAPDQDAVQEQLIAVAVNYKETGQIDPIIHFLDSLFMTARLHRNPAYRKGLAEADAAEVAGPPSDPIDISARMAELRPLLGAELVHTDHYA